MTSPPLETHRLENYIGGEWVASEAAEEDKAAAKARASAAPIPEPPYRSS